MAKSVIAKGSGTEVIYQFLRRDILRLEFAPGRELDEVAIAARYRVSRTPVREALIRLTAEGLVVSSKGKGSRVAALDIQNLRDFFEGLDLFQRAVARLAAIRRSSSDLEAIEAHMLAFEAGAARLDSEAINQTNNGFHMAVGKAAASNYLFSAYRRAHMDILRIGYVCFSESTNFDTEIRDHLQISCAEHRNLFEALSARNSDQAEACAGRYVDILRNRIVRTLMSTDLVRDISIQQAGN